MSYQDIPQSVEFATQLRAAIATANGLVNASSETLEQLYQDLVPEKFAINGVLNLSGIILSGADKDHILNLRHLYLPSTPACKIILEGAVFDYSDLTDANLTGADLRSTYFRGANLTDTNLAETNLTSANFWGACFTRTYINGANFTNATFLETVFVETNFFRTNLSKANLITVDLTDTTSLSTTTNYDDLIVWNDVALPERPPQWLQQLHDAASLPGARYAIWEGGRPAAYDTSTRPITPAEHSAAGGTAAPATDPKEIRKQ